MAVNVGKFCKLDVHMFTTTASVSTMNACYKNFKENVFLRKKDKMVLLGDFNARGGNVSGIDVIGMFFFKKCPTILVRN